MKSKLGRKRAHRKSLLRNLATSLVLYEEIETTLAKAKALKPELERVISRTKPLDLKAKRAAYAYFFDKNAAKKLINEIVPRYKNRDSGYLRIIRVKNRVGDNATLARIELVDKKMYVQNDAKTEKEDKESESQGSKKETKTKKDSK